MLFAALSAVIARI